MKKLDWLLDEEGDAVRHTGTDEWACGCLDITIRLLDTNEVIYRVVKMCNGHEKQYSYWRNQGNG